MYKHFTQTNWHGQIKLVPKINILVPTPGVSQYYDGRETWGAAGRCLVVVACVALLFLLQLLVSVDLVPDEDGSEDETQHDSSDVAVAGDTQFPFGVHAVHSRCRHHCKHVIP